MGGYHVHSLFYLFIFNEDYQSLFPSAYLHSDYEPVQLTKDELWQAMLRCGPLIPFIFVYDITVAVLPVNRLIT